MMRLLSLFFVFVSFSVFASDINDGTCNDGTCNGYYLTWYRHKANFGIEKVFVEFPHRPTETQSNFQKVAYTWDAQVLYSFSGYYPPIGNINPYGYFDEMLYTASQYPSIVLASTIYEEGDGYWILDYTAKDTISNAISYVRSVVSPFNAYNLAAVFPQGYVHHFEYFIDTFRIRCDCDH